MHRRDDFSPGCTHPAMVGCCVAFSKPKQGRAALMGTKLHLYNGRVCPLCSATPAKECCRKAAMNTTHAWSCSFTCGYIHTIDIHMQVYTGKATPFTE
ncbi:hypothetical protein GBAR_LOCUS19637 [Geodia barretti]|uniref:Uncharacterized protein n=1 Tax=Geodia barretti TaxID=519541 RepID=A0AA35WV54_GEOBA|nr:hypothetical protein GBAR_LOCUS19637 [Geodia barretti]